MLVVLGTLRKEYHSAVGGSVLSRVFATILSRSEHCAVAFFAQGAKNYTGVKFILLYRLILGTYITFVRKNDFLSPSVYCPDNSKRVPQIVTATETDEETDSFEIVQRIGARKIATPFARSRRVSLNGSIKNNGSCFAGRYVGLFPPQISSNFFESV